MSMATRTASGMFVGPGMNSELRPGMAVSSRLEMRGLRFGRRSGRVVVLGLDPAHRQGEVGGRRGAGGLHDSALDPNAPADGGRGDFAGGGGKRAAQDVGGALEGLDQ